MGIVLNIIVSQRFDKCYKIFQFTLRNLSHKFKYGITFFLPVAEIQNNKNLIQNPGY
jgi:hypothetical protein